MWEVILSVFGGRQAFHEKQVYDVGGERKNDWNVGILIVKAMGGSIQFHLQIMIS